MGKRRGAKKREEIEGAREQDVEAKLTGRELDLVTLQVSYEVPLDVLGELSRRDGEREVSSRAQEEVVELPFDL